MQFHPYLAFAGNAREAFTGYQEIFGGELDVLTASDTPDGVMADSPADAVLHAALVLPDGGLLMGADDPGGTFDGQNRGICVNCAVADTAEAKRVYDALAEGGSVQLELGETFFSPAFGMCTDRFGIPWMVNAPSPDAR
jgi:PhnB protein